MRATLNSWNVCGPSPRVGRGDWTRRLPRLARRPALTLLRVDLVLWRRRRGPAGAPAAQGDGGTAAEGAGEWRGSRPACRPRRGVRVQNSRRSRLLWTLVVVPGG